MWVCGGCKLHIIQTCDCGSRLKTYSHIHFYTPIVVLLYKNIRTMSKISIGNTTKKQCIQILCVSGSHQEKPFLQCHLLSVWYVLYYNLSKLSRSGMYSVTATWSSSNRARFLTTFICSEYKSVFIDIIVKLNFLWCYWMLVVLSNWGSAWLRNRNKGWRRIILNHANSLYIHSTWHLTSFQKWRRRLWRDFLKQAVTVRAMLMCLTRSTAERGSNALPVVIVITFIIIIISVQSDHIQHSNPISTVFNSDAYLKKEKAVFAG